VLGQFDTGYRAASDSVLTLDFTVQASRYSSGESLLQFYDNVERDVLSLASVRSVGWVTTLPLGASELGPWPFEIVGDAPVEAADRPRAEYSVASPGYFRTLDLPVVAGRGFTERDKGDTPAVCIVNEAFVRRHLQGRDPIGAQVSIGPTFLGPAKTLVREIVGVARQVKRRLDELSDAVQVYVPLSQNPYGDVFMVVSPTVGRPETLVPAIRAAVARHDANVPVRRIKTLEDVAGEATVRYRFRAVIVMTFAALALLLAMVGVFGVLAYAVQQRWRELGVRIALGATTGNVLALVLSSAGRVIAVGAAVGLVAAAALGQSISAFLFGVRPLDPVTFAAVAGVLALTGVIATAAPALRAARVDPVVVLRNE
jgi:predicted permease